MSDIKYIYKGNEPYHGTVKLGDKEMDLFMENNGEYILPADNLLVQGLKAQGLLVESGIDDIQPETTKIISLTKSNSKKD